MLIESRVDTRSDENRRDKKLWHKSKSELPSAACSMSK